MCDVGRIQKELPCHLHGNRINMWMAGEDASVKLLNGLAHPHDIALELRIANLFRIRDLNYASVSRRSSSAMGISSSMRHRSMRTKREQAGFGSARPTGFPRSEKSGYPTLRETA
jgi:hypothetical protein